MPRVRTNKASRDISVSASCFAELQTVSNEWGRTMKSMVEREITRFLDIHDHAVANNRRLPVP